MMKLKRWGMHLFYLLIIATLAVIALWLFRGRNAVTETYQRKEEQSRSNLLSGIERLCKELAGDLHSAADTTSHRLYLIKLTEIRTAVGQALVLLASDGRQTPWITFWQSLDQYSAEEADRVLEKEQLPEDRENLQMLAEIARWLSAHPEALLDETTESLPDELKLPTLQTAYSVAEKKTLQVARRALNMRGGLTRLAGGPPGIRSYGCANARVDVLQSGELVYLSLHLQPGEGELDDLKAADRMIEFARREGFGAVKLIDLYREGNEYRGRLAPLIKTAQLGWIPNLDRTLEIACTSWSGTVCHFSAGRYFSPSDHLQNQGLINDEKIEALAAQIGARVGDYFYYQGRICRPLISERIGYVGRTVTCVDASSGEEVDLFYVFSRRYGEQALY